MGQIFNTLKPVVTEAIDLLLTIYMYDSFFPRVNPDTLPVRLTFLVSWFSPLVWLVFCFLPLPVHKVFWCLQIFFLGSYQVYLILLNFFTRVKCRSFGMVMVIFSFSELV